MKNLVILSKHVYNSPQKGKAGDFINQTLLVFIGIATYWVCNGSDNYAR